MRETDSSPWYKQFWPWVLILLPLSAVVAGLCTVYIANHGADTPVNKDYYQAGIRINQRTHLIENAQRLGIQAQVHYNAQDQRLQIDLTGPQQNIEFLTVVLRHPAYETLDRTLELKSVANGLYSADFELPMKGKWYITATDNDKTWLLEDKIRLHDNVTLTLSPNVN